MIRRPRRSPLFPSTTLSRPRHYRDAARTLETALPSLDPARQATASLTLGIVYLGTAELHRELSQSATPMQLEYLKALAADRKSTRLNSSHLVISYAVFCLKK